MQVSCRYEEEHIGSNACSVRCAPLRSVRSALAVAHLTDALLSYLGIVLCALLCSLFSHRFRPPSKGEKAEGATIVASVDPSGTTVSLNDGTGVVKEGANKFNFDHCFDFTTSQVEVFNQTAKPLVKDVFTGFNTVRGRCTVRDHCVSTAPGSALTLLARCVAPCALQTIFAYGQTGSGKTWTMVRKRESSGSSSAQCLVCGP